MRYPDDFAAKVREVFPNSSQVEGWLRNGDVMLGRILDDGQTIFSGSQIVEAFEQGKTDDLLAQARKAKQVAELYKEWGKLYEAERGTARQR